MLTVHVRKHPAPEGALRRSHGVLLGLRVGVRKHPAPEGALRLNRMLLQVVTLNSQKAPSTTRCIKTLAEEGLSIPAVFRVRKHPAPEGALRHSDRSTRFGDPSVRKHPAPGGLLTGFTVHPHLLNELSDQAARQRKRS